MRWTLNSIDSSLIKSSSRENEKPIELIALRNNFPNDLSDEDVDVVDGDF